MDAACARALEQDVVAVGKLASALGNATENLITLLPPVVPGSSVRFALGPSEYAGLRPGSRPGPAPGAGMQQSLIDGISGAPREDS